MLENFFVQYIKFYIYIYIYICPCHANPRNLEIVACVHDVITVSLCITNLYATHLKFLNVHI